MDDSVKETDVNDEGQNDELDDGPSPEEMLAKLKEKAKVMGVSHSPNIGIDALRKKINSKLEGEESEADEIEEEAQAVAAKEKKTEKLLTKKQKIMALRKTMQEEQMKLIRCRIYNLNPSKRDLQGEIVTVGNKYLGSVKKFIPFGEATDNGYHIPNILYEELKRRRFQSITTKSVKGQIVVNNRMVPEYSLEVLPQLTKEQLKELADKQGAAERLGNE